MTIMRLIGALFILACVFDSAGHAGTPVQPKSSSTTSGNYREGRLYFADTQFDFGCVPQESFVSHSFWLVNKGGDTLEVIQIRPG